MVSNARDDFPEPLSPVMTTRRSRGMSTERFLRLCWRAPRTAITLLTITIPRQGDPHPPLKPSPPGRGRGATSRAQHLEPKDLAQLGWTGIGQNSTTYIDRWDHAIAAVPLLDA